MAEVSTALFLGDKLINPIFNERFVGINSFTQTDPSLVTDQSVLLLDATSETSYPGTGNTWFDLSTSTNNADVSLVTSYYNSGGWFDWPGTDYTAIATVADDVSLDVLDGDFTFLLAATIDTAAAGAGDNTGPFGFGNWFVNPGMGWLFNRNSGDGNYRKFSFYLNGSSLGLSTSTAFTNLGDFFVVHIVRSGSNVQYYNTANSSIGSFTNSANANNNSGVTIGRARNDATFNYKWDGKIAAIGLYDKALSSDERLANINYLQEKLGF